jgi:tetratricopeptide repeat protein/doubled CXXCH motif protein/cytochrome c554/c'-like protein
LFRRHLELSAGIILLLSAIASSWQTPDQNQKAASTPDVRGANSNLGDQACARCHAAIYDSYQRTSMAQASGPAIDGLIPAEFTHKASGVHYRIYSDDERAWLSYERQGDPQVRGKRELLYYIGSGRRGRSYLFETGAFLFESPINWYTDRRTWDMAPAYQSAREIPLNLPAYTSCLHCHVGGMQPPLAGTENRYPQPPFTHGGISCERCHGPGTAHIGGGAIINPAKLAPARRDEICMQCHLEGKVAIERPGRHVYEFRPGDSLADFIRYFVLVGGSSDSLGAVSQVEALAQSECKKKSGDAMSCTSCHDPHRTPTSEERVSYYREKCLVCHGAAFGAKHHADHPDCTACHMPASLSIDIAHTEVTDHRISAHPQIATRLLEDAENHPSVPRLVPFPPSQSVDPRDLALAWQSLAESGMSAAEHPAQEALGFAIKQAPDDPALLSALAYSAQKRKATGQARDLYEKALKIDPTSIDAAVNLGVIEAQAERLPAALRLWQDAFERAPDRSSIGMNIARAHCATGNLAAAKTTVVRVLEFNPDFGPAKEMLRQLEGSPSRCER